MKRIREIAFEGIDGAGKTTTISIVKRMLAQDGAQVEVVAPYREAAAHHGDIYEMWQDKVGVGLAVRAITEVIDDAHARAIANGADVLLYDRHWMTAFAEIDDNGAAKLRWGNRFVPTAFLRVSPDVALARIGETGEPWATRAQLGHYAEHYARLAFQYPHLLHGMYRSDTDVAPEAIARSIVWDMGARR